MVQTTSIKSVKTKAQANLNIVMTGRSSAVFLLWKQVPSHHYLRRNRLHNSPLLKVKTTSPAAQYNAQVFNIRSSGSFQFVIRLACPHRKGHHPGYKAGVA
jgi:hypothetical protein